MKCSDCNHEAHKPGLCKNCNCGESEVTHLTGFREITLDKMRPNLSNYGDSSITWAGYDCGHVVKKPRTNQ